MTIRGQFNMMKRLRIEVAQDEKEFAAFLTLLRRFRPRSLLEIGTREGGAFWMMGQTVTADGLLASVDLVGGPWGRPASGVKRQVVADLLRLQGRRVSLIDGDSADPEVIGQATAIAPPGGFDALFIDGDHSEKAVRADWFNYAPLVRRGGVIAFHDIVSRKVGVWRLWRELSKNKPHRAFYRRFGIGVVYR